ncbi:hypothetical protein B0A55_09441 [Friedmanniomyces simplex]|uniref:DOC domain-containing protein n=1 Tax=Friedmanniomyces simplex TaxID=329884 RepID=A0A4U0WS73_9PEZI|nr:hypothetical protein B0A55_09441 [Friedmanniomyces simplex]
MPTAARTRTRSRNGVLSAIEVPSDSSAPQQPVINVNTGEEEEVDDEEEEEEEVEEEEGVPEEDEEPEVFPPPGLKEISSLASWTVSTAKPGNGVAALRSPDPTHFWQSDGPQPHLLSIHFFKLVSIVSIEVLLDFENDESYTPTKIQFLAGMGVHDIQEFAEMTFEQPNGWHEVDFSNVGPIEQEDDEDEDADEIVDWSKRPVLRAFLLQVRILENHQNGKDTHLRGVRVFAREEGQQLRKVHAKPVSLPTASNFRRLAKHAEPNTINMAAWMTEPDLR